MIYFKKEMKVAKKLGINIQYDFKGCVVKKEDNNEENRKNKEADKYYSLKLGKNWKKRLREATLIAQEELTK